MKLKRLLRALTCLFGLVAISTVSRAADSLSFTPVFIQGHPAHPTRLLARLKSVSPATAHASVLAASSLRAVRSYDLVPGLVVLDVEPASQAMAAAGAANAEFEAAQLQARIEALRASGLFDYVEPDYVVAVDLLPTDSAFTDDTLWGLRNTGQYGGVVGVDVDAVRAWEITTGSTDVVVAVIDSGIRYTHQDLAAQMWRNPGETPGNRIDDDHNGYVDDVYGINAITNSGNPMDDEGHGTHVAGTIGAAANNGYPAVGVAWRVRLMACKFLDENGLGTTSSAIACINYAVNHGAKILNNSWGGERFTQSMLDVIAAAGAEGVLFIAAAGNDGQNTDQFPDYPSAYDLENVISVAAIDRFGERAGFSNFGFRSVDLAAPGVAIYSTVATTDASYDSFDGTSMAAPHVSGVAALVCAKYPGITVSDLRDRLLNTTVATPSLHGQVWTGGRVSAYQAVANTASGQLKLEVLPEHGSTLFNGHAETVVVRLTDVIRVRGAAVTGTLTGGGGLTFRDDGVAPDVIANDALYTALMNVPSTGATLTLNLQASAPGKVATQAEVVYNLQAPPSNDQFAQRTVITGPYGEWRSTNRGATSEPGEPKHAGVNGGASVWWSWTAPANTTVTVNAYGGWFDTLLAVYTGSLVSALTPIASNDDSNDPNSYYPHSSRVTFTAVAGTTYQLAVDGVDGATGDVSLDLRTTIAPANDNFADRITITGTTATVTGTNVSATSESGEPHPIGSGGAHSVWWTWTAPVSGTAFVIVNATGFNADVEVYTGADVAHLARAPGRIEEAEEDYSRFWQVTFPALAGDTYHFSVASRYYEQMGDFSLNLSMQSAPVNDLFANRIAIVGTDVTVSGQNRNATREAGEPLDVVNGFGSTVWWTWTAPQDGTVAVTIDGVARVFGVFTGSSVDALVRIVPSTSTPQAPVPGGIAFRVVAGTAYQISIDSGSFTGTMGDVVLHLALLPPPANDMFSDRLVLSGAVASATGTNLSATSEQGESQISGQASQASVWWTWTAPSSGTATIAISGADMMVGVFTGSTVGALVPVVNTERTAGYYPTRVVFHATAGQDYAIAVDGYYSHVGAFRFDLSLVDSPVNDNFADRVEVAGASITFSGVNAGATRETGEPLVDADALGASVWWSWTAPSSGTVSINAESRLVGVFTGAGVGGLQPVVDSDSRDAKVLFHAPAGVTYHIGVDSSRYSSVGGPFTVTLALLEAPVNDLFADRIALIGRSVAVEATTINATIESGEYQSGYRYGTGSVWWTWTAPADGTAILVPSVAQYVNRFTVYMGAALPSLTVVPNEYPDYNSGERRHVFRAVGGTTYQIRAEPYSGGSYEFTWQLSLVDPPSNDRFANRTHVSGATATFVSTSYGATLEPDERHYGLNSYGASVWWSWTAPASGTAIFKVTEFAFTPTMVVYTGGTLATLVEVFPAGGGSLAQGGLAIAAVAGTTYQLSISGEYGGWGDLTWTLALFTPPANDRFSSPTRLTGGSVTASGANVGATVETNEPWLASGISGGASVWWIWTAPADGVVQVTAASEDFWPMVNVFRGTDVAALTPVPGNQGQWDRVDSLVFRAIQGVTYRIGVDGYYGQVGAFTLSLNTLSPPANDNFTGRATLTGEIARASGAHFAATAEAGEPSHGTNPAKHSLWWSWTAPHDGTATVKVTRPVGGYSADVAVYTGSALSTLVPLAGGQWPTDQAMFHAVGGNSYQFVVDTSSAWGGDFDLEVSLLEAPANDLLTSATPLVGASNSVNGTNVGATAEPGEPTHYHAAFASVWYTWTAPANGRVVLEVACDAFNPIVALYRGTAATGLTRLESSAAYPGYSTNIVFTAVAGTVYQIAIDGLEQTTGHFTLGVIMVVPPINDMFIDRLSLVGDSAAATGSNFGATPEADTARSVWWTWTAPHGGPTIVTTAGSDFDTVVQVLTGMPGSMSNVAYNDDDPTGGTTSRVLFNAEAGATYQIMVGGRDVAMGSIILKVIMGQAPVAAIQTPNTNVLAGGVLTLSAEAQGAESCTYQWHLNGTPIPGATGSTYTVASAQQFLAGGYSVWVGNDFGSSTSPATTLTISEPAPSGARLTNLSTRALDLTGDKVLIPGFVVQGPGTKKLLIRAVGPTLAAAPFNLAGTLPNPRMALKRLDFSTTPPSYVDVAINDDWGTNPNVAELVTRAGELGAFNLVDGSADAALLVDLEPGQYSVIADDPAQQTGIAIVELYDADDATSSSRLINISNRGYVGAGDNIMIPGFVVSSEGPKTLLIRVIGPTLGVAPYNVPGVLADPTLSIYRHNFTNNTDELILTNDDWSVGPGATRTRDVATQVQAFALPEGSKDAAFVVTLNPGVYTVHARGKDDTEGVALVEVYAVP